MKVLQSFFLCLLSLLVRPCYGVYCMSNPEVGYPVTPLVTRVTRVRVAHTHTHSRLQVQYAQTPILGQVDST